METKHTPGPWSTYVNLMNDTTIRSMFPDGQERCEVARCRTSFDDARLIAAAPELLEALESIVVECSGPEKPYSADSYLPSKFIDAAHAAIAKATGGGA